MHDISRRELTALTDAEIDSVSGGNDPISITQFQLVNQNVAQNNLGLQNGFIFITAMKGMGGT